MDDNPLDSITSALEGEVEIGGRRIPKIALVAGGGIIIVVLFLLSKRGGGSETSPFRSTPENTETLGSENVGSDSGSSDSSGLIADLQAQFETALTDQNTTLADLIGENSNQLANDFANQIGGVYDTIAGIGGGLAPSYQDGFSPLPIDTGYGYDISPTVNTAFPAISNVIPLPDLSGKKSNATIAKPSSTKDKGGSLSSAKLGSASLKPDKSKVDQLTSKPKPNVGVLGFNKKENSIIPAATPDNKKVAKAVVKPSIKPSFANNVTSKPGNLSVAKPISIVTQNTGKTAKSGGFQAIIKNWQNQIKIPKVVSTYKSIVQSKPVSQPKPLSQAKPVTYKPKPFTSPKPVFGSAYGKIKGFKK